MEYNGYKPGYIYVLKSGPYYKIGYADDVEQRMKTVGASVKPDGLVEPIEFLFSFETSSKMIAERMLHDYFASKRVKGEWFELSDHSVETLRTFTTGELSVDEFVNKWHRIPGDLVLFSEEDIAFCQRFMIKVGEIMPDVLEEAIKQERIKRARADRAARYRKSLTKMLENMSVDDMEWIYETIMLRGARAEE
jgi:Meiotically Up-regulated Gene 113 (MUG113) protein